MNQQTAINLFTELDAALAWSEKEYQRGVKEAEAEGEEPSENPHTYSLRLDADDAAEDYAREYRLRITAGLWDTDAEAWKRVLSIASENDLNVRLDNHGIELS